MSKLEDTLAWQIKVSGLPKPEREFRFHPQRRWRFDMAYPNRLPPIAIEIDGGTYSGGRHVRGRGYEQDCEKMNEAILLGYYVLRVTARHIRNGQALRWIERALQRN